MPIHRPARIAISATGALIAAGLTGGALAAPTMAAESTTTVSFTDCEVRHLPYGVNTRVSDNITWTTPVRLNIPSPMQAGQSVTAEVDLGALPSGLVPEAMTEVYVDYEVVFTSLAGGNLYMELADRYFPTFDATSAPDLEEAENVESWGAVGVHDYSPKEAKVLITGLNAAGEFTEYSFACDQIVAPTTLLTVAVYDLNATPELTADVYAVGQGGTINLVGKHLLAAAPTTPPASVSVTIGGEAAGSFPLDAAGGFAGAVRVPDFVRPGATVAVQVTNGPKSASTQISVTAGRASIAASPTKVKRNKKVTLKGASFKPGETVAISLKGGKKKGKKSFSVKAKASSTGTISVKVKLKKAAKGAWKIAASGASSGRMATGSFKVK